MKLCSYYIAGTAYPRFNKKLDTISLDELRQTIAILSPIYVDIERIWAEASDLLPGQHMYVQNVGWIICLSNC